MDDEDAVQTIDDLKFLLKDRNAKSKIANKLNDVLDEMIKEFGLDEMDDNSFAMMPVEKKGDEVNTAKITPT